MKHWRSESGQYECNGDAAKGVVLKHEKGMGCRDEESGVNNEWEWKTAVRISTEVRVYV
jgi:hypothetical protein